MEPTIPVEPSFGELLEQALVERLVEQCSIESDRVVIRRGSQEHVMSREEGRAFLLGLLLGHWLHTVELPEMRSAAQNAGGEREATEASVASDRLMRRLDRLVNLAERMNLIEGVEMDEERGEVVLVLPDVKASMSLRDAADYLTTCIQDTKPHGANRSASIA